MDTNMLDIPTVIQLAEKFAAACGRWNFIALFRNVVA